MGKLVIDRLLSDRDNHVVPTKKRQCLSPSHQPKIKSHPAVKTSVSFILSRFRCLLLESQLKNGMFPRTIIESWKKSANFCLRYLWDCCPFYRLLDKTILSKGALASVLIMKAV